MSFHRGTQKERWRGGEKGRRMREIDILQRVISNYLFIKYTTDHSEKHTQTHSHLAKYFQIS